MIKKIAPVALAIFAFAALALLYCSPLLTGKVLSMHDTNMATAAAQELYDHHTKTGEWAWWTNSMFGGMPGFMIAGEYPYSGISMMGKYLGLVLPTPANVIFLLMVGFYVLMRVIKVDTWLTYLGSIAYAFGSYNLLFTEAGHLSKILALAYAPIVLAGFLLILQKNWGWGTLCLTLGLGLELYANHLQITYYLFFVLAAYGIWWVVDQIKSGQKIEWLPLIGSLVVAVLIGVGSHGMRLWNNLVYSGETMRGKSELSQSSAGANGLDVQYAFGWSYGIGETATLIVPNMYGGGSVGSLDESSKTYQALVGGGVGPADAQRFVQQMPMYVGQQPSTSGPAYSGIVIVFLYILGMFIRKTSWRWVEFGLLFLFIAWSWGSNLPGFNEASFQWIPGFNKFRAITMLLTLVHFIFVWGAVQTLAVLGETTWQGIKKYTIYVAAILVGFIGIGYMTTSYSASGDMNFQQSLAGSLGPDFAGNVIRALQSDRQSAAEADILRSLFLLGIIGAFVWARTSGKWKTATWTYAVLVVTIFDLILVDKRYFNNDDFVPAYQQKQTFEASAADLQILQDTSQYRVLNLTTGFWQDARDSYFHHSVGGYHGAKLKRMQELFDQQMVKEGQLNLPIFNMLNTKYFITAAQQGAPSVQQNPEALGNAWFVNSVKQVPTADEEMKSLGEINLATQAVLQEKYGKMLSAKIPASLDTTGSIRLTSYAPNKLVYQVETSSTAFAVFSEVFYRGNQDWISTLDGEVVPHTKVNYVLRGLLVPAGKHEIVFSFQPASVHKGQYIDLASSLALLILLGLVIGQSIRKK